MTKKSENRKASKSPTGQKRTVTRKDGRTTQVLKKEGRVISKIYKPTDKGQITAVRRDEPVERPSKSKDKSPGKEK